MQYYQQVSDLGLPIIKQFIINPSGECRHTIYVMERRSPHWGFNLSSALKYLWRLGVKTEDVESDLRKAIQYLTWELESCTAFDTRNTIETAIKMCEDLLG
jgi:Protein of unknwon function (DUF3310)